jgi:hypothetical protein
LRQRVSRLVRKTLSNSYVSGESHWGNLVFHPLLQCIITCLALPLRKALLNSHSLLEVPHLPLD